MIIVAVIVGAVLSLVFALAGMTIGVGAVLFGLIAWYAFTHQLIVPGVVFTLIALAFLGWTMRRHLRDRDQLGR